MCWNLPPSEVFIVLICIDLLIITIRGSIVLPISLPSTESAFIFAIASLLLSLTIFKLNLKYMHESVAPCLLGAGVFWLAVGILLLAN